MSLQAILSSVELFLSKKLPTFNAVPILVSNELNVFRGEQCNGQYNCIHYDLDQRLATKMKIYNCKCFLFKCSYCGYTTFGEGLSPGKKDLCYSCESVIQYEKDHNVELQGVRCFSCYYPLTGVWSKDQYKDSPMEWARENKHFLCWQRDWSNWDDIVRIPEVISKQQIEDIYKEQEFCKNPK